MSRDARKLAPEGWHGSHTPPPNPHGWPSLADDAAAKAAKEARKCIGLAGRLFGHKFSARYSYGAPKFPGELNGEITAMGLARVLEASKPKTYECDVCERCGTIVKKDEEQ